VKCSTSNRNEPSAAAVVENYKRDNAGEPNDIDTIIRTTRTAATTPAGVFNNVYNIVATCSLSLISRRRLRINSVCIYIYV